MLPDYDVIGRRIKEARLEQGLTQEELADKIDISIAFMSRVERGSAQINLKRLTQLAEVLNVTPGYFLTGSNVQSKEYLRRDFRMVLDRCTPEQQKLIFKIAELVSKVNVGTSNEKY